ncbi:MAG: DUF4157 domain-containing protein [bacterium]|nr:DUF4157 domain-containing protein [bacterium]
MSNDEKNNEQKSDFVYKKENKDKKIQRKTTYQADPGSDFILKMQKTVGNQEVQRMIKDRVLQAKLTVGSPNDKYEQEADRVAEQVVNMTDAQVQTKQDDESIVQSKGSPQGTEVSSDFESGLNNIKGTGSPLNKQVRQYYEQRLNAYLGDVRIHTGNKADRLARSINAEAFTTKHDIVFAARRFDPNSRQGKKLLGHELTHVLQQGGGRKRNKNTPETQKKAGKPIATNKITPSVSRVQRNEEVVQRWLGFFQSMGSHAAQEYLGNRQIVNAIERNKPKAMKRAMKKESQYYKLQLAKPYEIIYINATYELEFQWVMTENRERCFETMDVEKVEFSNENRNSYSRLVRETQAGNEVDLIEESYPIILSPIIIDNFPFDKADIPLGGELLIDNFSKLVDPKAVEIRSVIGHTDKVGDSEYNKSLSKQRVDAVRNALWFKGYLRGGISVKKGEKDAKIKESASTESRGSDRKVEIHWVRKTRNFGVVG